MTKSGYSYLNMTFVCYIAMHTQVVSHISLKHITIANYNLKMQAAVASRKILAMWLFIINFVDVFWAK